MSWLARSIANTLKLDDDDGDQSSNTSNINQKETKNNYPNSATEQDNDPSSPTSPSRGVKEDISELTKTLSRQFWGVASFLAPPPQAEPYKPLQDSDINKPDEKLKLDLATDHEGSNQVSIGGIRSDFAEIGGRFRSGIERLSNNKTVSEFTKIASNFLQLGSDDEEKEGRMNDLAGGAVGVTEDVVAFARDIAMHPETWMDFPLPGDDDDDDDEFNMSDAQQEHALAVEHLAPRLAALRIELCPGYMSEGYFWKIYFVLLHPRLEKEDAEHLSTPLIVEARALLSQQLQKCTKEKQEDWSEKGVGDAKDSTDIQPEETLSVPPSITGSGNVPITSVESATSSSEAETETEKHPVTSNEIEIVDKSVIEEKHVDQAKGGILHSDSLNLLLDKDEDDGDDWLKEESSEVGGSGATIAIENEDDVSFSDLEEDDGDASASFKKISYSSDKDSRDWVQLSKSSADSSKSTYDVDVEPAGSKKVMPNNPEMKESSDWLDVDDIDVA